MVEDNVELGKNVVIFNPDLVNIYKCSIDDNSFIGPFVEITYGVKIGKNCKIESHSFLCDGVILEDDVFVGHGVMFTNDLYPMTFRQVAHLETRVKRGASLGSNSSIVGGITIGEFAIVGAGSVVTKDVPDFSIVAGNPAKILKQFKSKKEILEYFLLKQPTIEND